MPGKTQPEVLVRTAVPEDAPACGQICYDAFSAINAAHGFPSDFPGPEVTTGLLSTMFASPDFYCVVAERGGRIMGSNCLDERSAIRGLGPITIDPGESGPFHRLMDLPQPIDLTDTALPQGWCNFWRQDDWSGTAYFYLDTPTGVLA